MLVAFVLVMRMIVRVAVVRMPTFSGRASRGGPTERELRDGGCGDRDVAVGSQNSSAAKRHLRGGNLADAQQPQPLADADYVSDGVQRAHLVEVHLVGGDPVHVPLRLGQSGENLQRHLAGCFGDRRFAQQLPDRRPASVRGILGEALNGDLH